jgi:pyruvate formate lyase activating enzyme
MKDSKVVTLEWVIEKIKHYSPIFKFSNGGVTFSGGEPLMQRDFLEAILEYCKEQGIHTAVDTAGSLPKNLTDKILQDTSLFLFDIKSGTDELYRQVTSSPITPVLESIEKINSSDAKVWVRFVLVPGLTDSKINIEKVAHIASTIKNLVKFQILPFHQLGKHKWEDLGLEYKLANFDTPTNEKLAEATEIIKSFNLPI